MKTTLALACALALGGCGTLSSGGGGSEALALLKEVATDPRCGHVDRIQGNVGGLGGNNLSVYAERTCPPAPTE